MTERGPSRVRTMAPADVDSHAAAHADQDAELVRRLEVALASLPDAERTAVVAAIGLAGGSVGASMVRGRVGEDADALTRNGLQLLRGALADIDAHGSPLG